MLYFFFSICTSYRRGLLGRGGCEDGGERRESRADFDGGGKLEKELYEGDKLMCAARPPGLQDLLGILRRWLKSQLSLKRRPTLPFNLKGVSNTVTGLQNRSQTETPRRLLGTQLLRPPVLMTNAAINFFLKKGGFGTKTSHLIHLVYRRCCSSKHLDVLYSFFLFYPSQMRLKSLTFTPAGLLRRRRCFHSPEGTL